MDKRFDMTGQVFGKLRVIERGPSNDAGQTMWVCVCDCGTTKLIRAYTLRNGGSRSCGCQQRIGNNRTHGMTETTTYKSWCHMKARCDNPTNEKYPRYGGRGITYDPRWASFETFLADMGEKPPGRYSIERKDNDGNYTKKNCEWATDLAQANNSSHVHGVSFLGFTMSIAEWARRTGISRLTLTDRLSRGWPVEKALMTKPRGTDDSSP